jgi:hypothetical protein
LEGAHSPSAPQVYPPFLDRLGNWQKGEACGYLKLNEGAHNCVSLFLLPYNYPALLHLVRVHSSP